MIKIKSILLLLLLPTLMLLLVACGGGGLSEADIEQYGGAIRLNTQDADAYYSRGNAYVRLGQYERAVQDYDEVIRLNLQDDDAYINRGFAYGRLGQYERAIQDFDEAIRLNPQYTIAYLTRGLAYGYLGQYERAIQDYDEAIRINPQYAYAYGDRGLAYGYLGQHERAIQDYDEAMVKALTSQILAVLGSTGVLLAFDNSASRFDTVGQYHTFQWVGNPSFGSVNGVPVVGLNGVNQGAVSPDDPYWSIGNGESDGPFSIVIWVKVAPNFGSGNLFGKYRFGDRNRENKMHREWLLQFESSDSVIGVIRDESTDGVIGGGLKPRWKGLPTLNGWFMLAFTYDGSSTIDGTEIWYNAQPVKNDQTIYENYVASEGRDSAVSLGFFYYDGKPAQFFKGQLAGGFCGPTFTKKELNQTELEQLHSLCFPFLTP